MTTRRSRTEAFSLFAFQDIITSVSAITILVTLLLALELTHTIGQAPSSLTTNLPSDRIEEAIAAARESAETLKKKSQNRQAELLERSQMTPVEIERRTHEAAEVISRSTREIEEIHQLTTDLDEQRIAWQAKKLESIAVARKIKEVEKDLSAIKGELDELRSSNRLIFTPRKDSGRRAWIVDINNARILVAEAGKTRTPLKFTNTVGDHEESFLSWSSNRSSDSEYFVLFVRPDGIDRYIRINERLIDLGFRVGLDLIDAESIVIDPEKGAGF